ncbi:MAG: hypothetical protein ABIJ52_03140 [Pseudomonadota bacterium]|nr:hypothetical protein [Pseudomonadota bacterium]
MYKFTGLNIDHFLQDELIEVSIVQFNIFFKFESNNFINICGKWSIYNNENNVVEEGNAEKHNNSIKAHQLLGQKIKKYEIPNPEELRIIFSNDYSLRIYDDNTMYECCAISPNTYI